MKSTILVTLLTVCIALPSTAQDSTLFLPDSVLFPFISQRLEAWDDQAVALENPLPYAEVVTWHFPDGTTSNTANPSFLFDSCQTDTFMVTGTTNCIEPIGSIICDTAYIEAAIKHSPQSNFVVAPNPCTYPIQLQFHLPDPTKAELHLTDMNGNMVQTVVSQHLPAGPQSYAINPQKFGYAPGSSFFAIWAVEGRTYTYPIITAP